MKIKFNRNATKQKNYLAWVLLVTIETVFVGKAYFGT